MGLEGNPYPYTVVIWLELQPCIMIAKPLSPVTTGEEHMFGAIGRVASLS